ncbi:MAG: 4-hydroxy-tetrahydrodipicolinate synthase [Rhodobacteraceae bacterium]|nr:4-hydroxy-tetrahydrodipicolinate synthase [Paracoccaceae bacterium]
MDIGAYERFIAFQIDSGTHGIVPCGTTGESPTISGEEHKSLIKTAVKSAKGKIPVIAGTGSNCTDEAVEMTRYAEDVGADGALVVTPYYNKPTQEGLYQHYKKINDNCGIPIVIYNIPGRSVVDMSPETMGTLAKLPNIIGVKDATGDLARVCDQRISCGADFLQISGEDATAHGFNAQGGVGCISVTANVAPALCAHMQEATLRGDYAAALELQDRLMPLHKAIFTEPGLVGAKYAMSELGLCSDEVRLPLVPLTDGTKEKVRDALRHAGLLN